MKKNLSRMGLPIGFLVLILLLLIPTPPELSTAATACWPSSCSPSSSG